MAGFFSLGSGSGSGSGNGRDQSTNQPQLQLDNTNDDEDNGTNAPNSWNSGVLLYRNEEIYQKGFEIWQQYVQVHHQHPKLMQDHLHHHHPHHPFLLHHHHQQLARSSSAVAGPPMTRSMMRSSTSLGGGGVNCQDCGNQSKKDCAHSRCRTCCRSRGFDCPTHVKSTWVPAAQRRERQQRLSALQQQPQPSIATATMMKGETSDHHRHKRPREDMDLACTSTGLALGQHFPAEVSAPAEFRCVRVHSTDAADEQLAYRTTVNIGGRVFEGILYDQGPDRRYNNATPGSSSGGEGGPPALQHHNLLTANAETHGGSTAAPIDGNSGGNTMYPPAISAFLAGTQFFPPPRS